MRQFLRLLVAMSCVVSLRAATWTEIPETRSPDGKHALFYQHTGKARNDPRYYAFCFLGPKHLMESAQLVQYPGDQKVIEQPNDWKKDDDFSSWMLFNDVASQAEESGAGGQRNPAFNSAVAWSKDSRWVSVAEGEHKFWHMEAWHLVDGRFERVDLSKESKLVWEYYKTHAVNPPIQQLGMEKKVTTIRGRSCLWSSVGWFGNGIFVVNGYPILLNDPQFNLLRGRDGEIYFLVDCREVKGPRVVGVCH